MAKDGPPAAAQLPDELLEEDEPSPWPAIPRVDRQVALAAARLLREPTWRRALLGVIVLSVAFVLLGRWQWHRHEYKVARADRIVANYSAPAVPITQLLPDPQRPLPAALEWRPVQVRGTYDAGEIVLVRHRPLDNDTGYEVLVPLRTAEGQVLLVDRGWIPAGATAERPDAVPAPPPGTVDVVVRMRRPEPPEGRAPPPGQAESIDVARIARRLGEPAVYSGYGVLAREVPRPQQVPTLLPRPSTDLGPHLAYAIQWWGFAVTAYALLVAFAVREAQRRLGLRLPA
jgi:cytochrome oxidase assembly protein ShyY1